MSDITGHGKPLPSAEREQQLRLELQQLNHQISQQTQLRGLEVCTCVFEETRDEVGGEREREKAEVKYAYEKPFILPLMF